MATPEQMRVGDADRDAVAASLREHFAEGRLTLDELNQRLDAAFAARTRSDLDKVTGDLPYVTAQQGPLPAQAVPGWHGGGERHGRRRGGGIFWVPAALMWILVAVLATSAFGFGGRGRLGVMLLLIFAVFRWVLRGLSRPCRGPGPWPGRRGRRRC